MNSNKTNLRLAAACATLLALACSDSPTSVGATALLSVTPSDGDAGVGTRPTIDVRFGRPLASGAAALIALQVGDCPGPVVDGMWSRSADGSVLSFVPTEALDPGVRYTIHLGGGMTDADGALVDLEQNGSALGGMWVTESMVMGMNSMGMTTGMGSMVSHSGPGWRNPNGYYGLAFDFTTGGG